MDTKQNSIMRTRAVPQCYCCGAEGEIVHRNLRDRLYDVPGEWSHRRCTNNKCGLLWLDPVPIEEDIGLAYASYFTHATANHSRAYLFKQKIKRGFAGLAFGYQATTTLGERLLAIPVYLLPPFRLQIIASAFLYLRGEQRGKLLEIGCGNGTLLKNLSDLGWDVEGLDFDSQAIAAIQKNLGLKARTGALTAQSYPPNSFDAIVMSHVIEHLHDPVAVLTECFRILKPGGKLVMATPNLQALSYQQFDAAWLSLDPPRHLYLFSSQNFSAMTEKSGLTVKEIFTTARSADDIWLASKKIQTGQTSFGWRDKLQAQLFTLREWLRLRTKPNAGEEIILIAEKR